MATPEISVSEYVRRRDAGEAMVLLDVREPDEWATAHVPGALDIRMGEIPTRAGELPTDVPLVVMCHHGGRSERVVQYLQANGFPNAINLAGGIDSYARAVDPTIPTY
jgi:rhodanese-related sulfurtransferase